MLVHLMFFQETLAAAAKSLQSCPTLCDPTDSSPPGSAIPGILQARTLEWVAISFSSAWKWKVKVKSLSRVQLLATPWTVAHQVPPSMGFSKQEYWSGVPLPSPTPKLIAPYFYFFMFKSILLKLFGNSGSSTKFDHWTQNRHEFLILVCCGFGYMYFSK